MPVILCIDDRQVSLTIRKLMLETQGYCVLTADDGPSGLKLLSDNQVDAVVLDYQLKGMDGFAVATAIRERHGKLPIVLLSGHPTGIPGELLRLVDAYIVKGQSPPDALLKELRRVTGAKKPSTKDVVARTKDLLDKKSG